MLKHEGMLLPALRKTPHPEAPREARPRRSRQLPDLLSFIASQSTQFRGVSLHLHHLTRIEGAAPAAAFLSR